MSGVAIVVIAIALLLCGYFIYGRWLQKTWGIDPKAKTPAYTHEDGVDYVPTSTMGVFSHQFSSITGAGPVTGPIIAAKFGWLPALLWIIFGGIFFGAVQDFGSLYASVKNEGKSIGLVIEQYIGKTGKKLFLIFCWLFSLLVVAAFGDIVATTFTGIAEDGTLSLSAASAGTTSLLFIVASMVLGLIQKYFKPGQAVQTVLGLVLLVACFLLGVQFPLYLTKMGWMYIVFVYLFLASVTPIWLLMQPRDFMSTFMLIGMIVAAVIGVLVEGPTVNLNAFNGFEVGGSYLFPTLFVTIACGAVSGFHSLVSTGTSSKQISNEKSMLPVGFGAMMVECVLAVVALVVAGSVAVGGQLPEGTPFQIFSGGVAGFLNRFGISETYANCFMTMCISTLALTSLDSVARIGRMSFQEFFEPDAGKEQNVVGKTLSNKYIATVFTLIAGFALALGGYSSVWPLFGSANQLLAALVLIAVAVFLKVTGRKGAMLYAPMFIMLAVTFTALVMAIYNIVIKLTAGGFNFGTDGLQLIVAVLLVALGLLVAGSCLKQLFGGKKTATSMNN